MEQDPSTRGTETILVVDDEAGIRKLIRSTLAARGYQVLDADTGDTAMALVAEHGRPIDLLVTDSLMEEMSGAALAEKLTISQPSLKVLFISGYANTDLKTPVQLGKGQSFLQKPFSMLELARRIREVLDSSGAE
jgi:two-component system cell cycle sensor histidine kinase/response regulator CckA